MPRQKSIDSAGICDVVFSPGRNSQNVKRKVEKLVGKDEFILKVQNLVSDENISNQKRRYGAESFGFYGIYMVEVLKVYLGELEVEK